MNASRRNTFVENHYVTRFWNNSGRNLNRRIPRLIYKRIYTSLCTLIGRNVRLHFPNSQRNCFVLIPSLLFRVSCTRSICDSHKRYKNKKIECDVPQKYIYNAKEFFSLSGLLAWYSCKGEIKDMPALKHRAGCDDRFTAQEFSNKHSNKEKSDKFRSNFLQTLRKDREQRFRKKTSFIASNRTSESKQDSLLSKAPKKSCSSSLFSSRSFLKNDKSFIFPVGQNWKGKTSNGAKAFRDRKKTARLCSEHWDSHQDGFNGINKQFPSNDPPTTYKQIGVDLTVSADNIRQSLVNNDIYVSNDSDSPPENDKKIVVLPYRSTSLSELSSLFRISVGSLLTTLRGLGENPPRKNYDAKSHVVDMDVAELIALELGFVPNRVQHNVNWKNMSISEGRMLRISHSQQLEMKNDFQIGKEIQPVSLSPRPPVVCILGHVDHGKTTLLDALRYMAHGGTFVSRKQCKARKEKKKQDRREELPTNDCKIINSVAGTEVGGITQAVSAFEVVLPPGLRYLMGTKGIHDHDTEDFSTITFLDTPGHAAFEAMRQSGSNCADIMVLVIAADDGVSLQTIEILNMFKSISKSQPGSISLVVAMTKIDKPGIHMEESLAKIENQLGQHEVYVESMSNGEEEFGGVQLIPVSGLTGEGLENLIEGLVLQSQIMDLKADKQARAEGLVIDAKVPKYCQLFSMYLT